MKKKLTEKKVVWVIEISYATDQSVFHVVESETKPVIEEVNALYGTKYKLAFDDDDQTGEYTQLLDGGLFCAQRQVVKKTLPFEEASKEMTKYELKALRKKTGLNQIGFGELFGYKKLTIASYEQGRNEVPQVLAMAIRYYMESEWT